MEDFRIIAEISEGRVSCRQYGNSQLSFIVIESLDIEGRLRNPLFTNNYWVYCGILPPERDFSEIFLHEFISGFDSKLGIVYQE